MLAGSLPHDLRHVERDAGAPRMAKDEHLGLGKRTEVHLRRLGEGRLGREPPVVNACDHVVAAHRNAVVERGRLAHGTAGDVTVERDILAKEPPVK